MKSAPSPDRDHWLPLLIHSKIAWCTLIVLILLGCAVDIWNIFEFGSVDLRNRVVGARLLVDGKNPYRYQWQPGDPETYLDPLARRPNALPTRVTVSPAALAVYALLADFHYRTQQVLWLILQWAAAVAIMFLLAGAASSTTDRRLLLIIIGFFFLTGESWRLHVERGQIYVFYALLLAVAYRLGHFRSGFACGLLLGFGIPFRLTFAMTFVPFLVVKRTAVIAGGVCGLLLGILATLPLADLPTWRNYFAGMQSVEQFFLRTPQAPKLSSVAPELPSTVEGMPNLSRAKRFAVSPLRLYNWSWLAPAGLRSYLLKFGALSAVLLFANLLWRRRGSAPPLASCLIAGITLMMVIDFFLPAPRQAYNNILWCVPVGLLIIRDGAEGFVQNRSSGLLCAGLLITGGVIHAGAIDIFGLANLVVAGVMVFISVRLTPDRPEESCHVS